MIDPLTGDTLSLTESFLFLLSEALLLIIILAVIVGRRLHLQRGRHHVRE